MRSSITTNSNENALTDINEKINALLDVTAVSNSPECSKAKKSYSFNTAKLVFVKSVKLTNSNCFEEDILRLAKSVPNYGFLTELLQVCVVQNKKIFHLRFCHYGTLNNVLNKIGPVPMHASHFVKIAYSLVYALDFLHSQEISHGFITTEHCLVDEYGYIRLCGLGNLFHGTLATCYRWIDNENTGYFAPELIATNKEEFIDPFLVDMFAYGVVLHLCLTGLFPYSSSTNNNAVFSKENQKAQLQQDALKLLFLSPDNVKVSLDKKEYLNVFLSHSQRPFSCLSLNAKFIGTSQPHEFIVEALGLINKLLNNNQNIRLRAGAVLYSSWLQNGIKQELKSPSMNSLFF